MTLIQNGIDEVRRNVTMYIDQNNNGASGMDGEWIDRINGFAGRNNGLNVLKYYFNLIFNKY